MSVRVSISTGLVEQALAISGENTPEAGVQRALEEFIARRSQKPLLELMGRLEWDTRTDYKSDRSRG